MIIDKEEPDYEFNDKNGHDEQAVRTEFIQHQRPGYEKCNFEIKYNEQDCDEVITDVEFCAAVFEGFETAFVWRIFFRSGLVLWHCESGLSADFLTLYWCHHRLALRIQLQVSRGNVMSGNPC